MFNSVLDIWFIFHILGHNGIPISRSLSFGHNIYGHENSAINFASTQINPFRSYGGNIGIGTIQQVNGEFFVDMIRTNSQKSTLQFIGYNNVDSSTRNAYGPPPVIHSFRPYGGVISNHNNGDKFIFVLITGTVLNVFMYFATQFSGFLEPCTRFYSPNDIHGPYGIGSFHNHGELVLNGP